MTTVCKSFHTREDTGAKSYTVLVNASPVMASTTGEEHAWEYARALYHRQRAPKRLVIWNGDTGTETLEDECLH